MLRDLRHRLPRNRVVWLESAATALRDERPSLAAASLREWFAMLEADDRARMLGEEALWRYTRGATRLWVSGRTHLELGKLADLAGAREEARRHYAQARTLCNEGRDKKGVAAAKRFHSTAYSRRP